MKTKRIKILFLFKDLGSFQANQFTKILAKLWVLKMKFSPFLLQIRKINCLKSLHNVWKLIQKMKWGIKKRGSTGQSTKPKCARTGQRSAVAVMERNASSRMETEKLLISKLLTRNTRARLAKVLKIHFTVLTAADVCSSMKPKTFDSATNTSTLRKWFCWNEL